MSRAFNRFRNWNKVSPNSPSKVFLAYAAENEITVIPCEETFVNDNQAHENYESSSTDVQETTDVSSHEDTHPIQLPSHESNEAQQKNKTFAVPTEFITKPFDFKHPLMICWFYNDNKDNEVVKNIITGLDSCFTNTRYHSETEISQTPISVTLDKEMLQWAFFGKISSNDKQLIERLLNSGISVLYPKKYEKTISQPKTDALKTSKDDQLIGIPDSVSVIAREKDILRKMIDAIDALPRKRMAILLDTIISLCIKKNFYQLCINTGLLDKNKAFQNEQLLIETAIAEKRNNFLSFFFKKGGWKNLYTHDIKLRREKLLPVYIELDSFKEAEDDEILPTSETDMVDEWLTIASLKNQTQFVKYFCETLKLGESRLLKSFVNAGNFNLAKEYNVIPENEASWDKEMIKTVFDNQSIPFIKYFIEKEFNLRNYFDPTIEEKTLETFQKHVDLKVFPSDCNMYQLLFLKYVQENKLKMSLLLWCYIDGHIPAALLATRWYQEKLCQQKDMKPSNENSKQHPKALLRSDERVNKDDECKSFIKGYKTYLKLTKKAIKRCYQNNAEVTVDMLGNRMTNWGEATCFELACDIDKQESTDEKESNKKLLQLKAFHDLSQIVWQNGTANERQPSKRCFCYTPRIAFIVDLVFNLGFLVLYGVLLMLCLEAKTVHPTEYVVKIWTFFNLLEWFYQLVARVSRKFMSMETRLLVWKIFGTLLYCTATSLRWIAFTDDNYENLMQIARLFYGLDFMVRSIGLFAFFSGFITLGPILSIFLIMMKYDIFDIAVMTAVFVLTYSVVERAVLGFSEHDTPFSCTFKNPFWSIFGNFDLDEFYPKECSEKSSSVNDYVLASKYIVLFLYGSFVIIVNIVLINYLIAKFNSTIEDNTIQSEKEWRRQSIALTWKYSHFCYLPSPFTICTLLLQTCKDGVDEPVDRKFVTHLEVKDKSEYIDSTDYYYQFENDSLDSLIKQMEVQQSDTRIDRAAKWSNKEYKVFCESPTLSSISQMQSQISLLFDEKLLKMEQMFSKKDNMSEVLQNIPGEAKSMTSGDAEESQECCKETKAAALVVTGEKTKNTEVLQKSSLETTESTSTQIGDNQINTEVLERISVETKASASTQTGATEKMQNPKVVKLSPEDIKKIVDEINSGITNQQRANSRATTAGSRSRRFSGETFYSDRARDNIYQFQQRRASLGRIYSVESKKNLEQDREAAVAILTSSRPVFSASRKAKAKARTAYYAVRMRSKFGTRWHCYKVKPNKSDEG